MGKLDGKVALVTGGGGGVARGMTVALANEGATISIVELDPLTNAAGTEVGELRARA